MDKYPQTLESTVSWPCSKDQFGEAHNLCGFFDAVRGVDSIRLSFLKLQVVTTVTLYLLSVPVFGTCRQDFDTFEL